MIKKLQILTFVTKYWQNDDMFHTVFTMYSFVWFLIVLHFGFSSLRCKDTLIINTECPDRAPYRQTLLHIGYFLSIKYWTLILSVLWNRSQQIINLTIDQSNDCYFIYEMLESKKKKKKLFLSEPKITDCLFCLTGAMDYTGVIQWQTFGSPVEKLPIERAMINRRGSSSPDRLPPSAG